MSTYFKSLFLVRSNFRDLPPLMIKLQPGDPYKSVAYKKMRVVDQYGKNNIIRKARPVLALL